MTKLAFTLLYVVGILRILIIVFIILIPVVLTIIISIAGKKRKIGFWISLLLCIFFTPIVGLIAVLLSEKKSLEQHSNALK